MLPMMINGKLSKKQLTRQIFIFLLSEINMAQSKKQPESVTQKRNLIMQLKEKFLYWHLLWTVM